MLYHFDRAATGGAAQFDDFLNAIKGAGGPRAFPLDLLCLDSEDTQSPGLAATSARAFTNRAASLGYQGCVYTGNWFANPHGITAALVHPSWQRLWLSDYNPDHADETMPLPAGWDRTQVIARQFTSGATVPGISGRADYSRVLNDWLTKDENVAITDAEFDKIATLTWTKVAQGLTDPAHPKLVVDHTDLDRDVATLKAQVAALAARPVVAGAVDLDVLAAKLADLLAKRLAS